MVVEMVLYQHLVMKQKDDFTPIKKSLYLNPHGPTGKISHAFRICAFLLIAKGFVGTARLRTFGNELLVVKIPPLLFNFII
jgi:hypothetical protein